MIKGINVNHIQGNINWKNVKKAGMQFAIICAGLNNKKDSQFESNYAGCKEHNIPCGVVWSSYAKTVGDSKCEVENLLDIIKDKNFEYPVWLNVDFISDNGKERCNAIAKAFIEAVESAGYTVGIKGSTFVLEHYIDESLKSNRPVYVSQISVDKPDYSGNYDMWEYSCKGRVRGIKGYVNMSNCYTDYSATTIKRSETAQNATETAVNSKPKKNTDKAKTANKSENKAVLDGTKQKTE